ncbi:LVIVD repeat-containing protein [Rufibacter roseus]|uniref:Uncharacterized protein n=1 Tax=Rufibacter roseus TaxID=1567108 RepID=A0ABW2DL08_9BACT|nr:hypothetical protein [Rufibacter roseus]
MKKHLYLLLAFAMVFSLWGCPAPIEEEGFSNYVPILMQRNQLEASVVLKPARAISKPGKIYRYGNLLLINEQYKGVHFIDNSNPSSPQKVGFLQVPGCIDFAVKENVLFVDNAVDLVAVDITDVQHAQITKRVKNVFPQLMAPDNMQSNITLGGAIKDAIIVGWELKSN